MAKIEMQVFSKEFQFFLNSLPQLEKEIWVPGIFHKGHVSAYFLYQSEGGFSADAVLA